MSNNIHESGQKTREKHWSQASALLGVIFILFTYEYLKVGCADALDFHNTGLILHMVTMNIVFLADGCLLICWHQCSLSHSDINSGRFYFCGVHLQISQGRLTVVQMY